MTDEERLQARLNQSVKDIKARLKPQMDTHWSIGAMRERRMKALAAGWKRLAREQSKMLDEYQEFTEQLLRDLEERAAKD